jgi:hypothetical protein
MIRDINTNQKVSVYLDNDCSIGISRDDAGKPEPYWEVCNINKARDVVRCLFSEGNAKLLEVIKQEIEGDDLPEWKIAF